MKKKSTDTDHYQTAVEGCAEVVVNTRVTGLFKYKKLAVAASLGFAAFAASLP